MEIDEDKIAAFDMSFTSFVVSEHGRMENPRYYRRHQKNLKKLHRELSRKKKGSKNRDKARITLARYYEKIGNQRNDWQHKQSLKLARTYDAVILEDLNIEAMKRFNKGFAKTVTLDFSWSEFVRMVHYKMVRRGKQLVGRFYPSSQLCSKCGYKNDALKSRTGNGPAPNVERVTNAMKTPQKTLKRKEHESFSTKEISRLSPQLPWGPREVTLLETV
jgi:putative transposase